MVEDLRQELVRATGPRAGEELRRGILFDDFAAGHEHDAIGNAAGLPSVAVPDGFGDRGLPTSIQFVGRAWGENTILAAARAYQARTDWHRRHPNVG